jgi:predicted kinase
VRISSDIVRKGLAGLPGKAHAKPGFEEGIYSPAWTHRTYNASPARVSLVGLTGGTSQPIKFIESQ